MAGYQSRIEKDLARWQQAGFVSPEHARAILQDIAKQDKGTRLFAVLSILGAVLICFAAMSFVAANWQALSKIARLVLLFGSMWAAYGAAYQLARREMPAFAEAAILIGIGLYGAAIMLVAQMYHIDGHPPDAVLWWALGALLAGLALQSRAALAAAMILFVLWSAWEIGLDWRVHWAFLLPWLVTTVAILGVGWRGGLHLSALALAWFIIMYGYEGSRSPALIPGVWARPPDAHHMVVLVGLALMALALWQRAAIERWTGFERAAPVYAAATALAGMFAIQIVNFQVFGVYQSSSVIGSDAKALTVIAIATLVLVLGVIALGARFTNRGLMWLGYAGFCGEILFLYFRTFGSLISTSLFFLTAGMLVMGLSALAWWLNKRQGIVTEAPA